LCYATQNLLNVFHCALSAKLVIIKLNIVKTIVEPFKI